MTPQQSTIHTLVLSGKYHRYKNWQVKNRCKRVVKGRHWAKISNDYYHFRYDYIDDINAALYKLKSVESQNFINNWQ